MSHHGGYLPGQTFFQQLSLEPMQRCTLHKSRDLFLGPDNTHLTRIIVFFHCVSLIYGALEVASSNTVCNPEPTTVCKC